MQVFHHIQSLREALAAERTRLVQALDATTASLDTALGDLLGGGRLPQPTAADLCRALGPQDSIAIPVVSNTKDPVHKHLFTGKL